MFSPAASRVSPRPAATVGLGKRPRPTVSACSLIVSIYNQAPQLALVLRTAALQTRRDFEIILADDGSSDDVDAVIEWFCAANHAIPLRRIRQEDRGFRKSRILNAACRASRSDYCIVVDGDMLLHPRFIENHLRYRNPQWVLCGYRGVRLGPRYTQALLDGRERFLPATTEMLRRHRRKDLLSSPLRALILHNALLRRLAVPVRNGLAGCNFSLYRHAIEQVNGWDETICRYGYEDYELGHRLCLAGHRIVNVSKCCNTYHLYHPKGPKPDLGAVKRRIDESRQPQCRHGLRTLPQGSQNTDFRTAGPSER